MKRKHILPIILLLFIEPLTAQRVVFRSQLTKISITVKNAQRREVIVETNPINMALMPSRPDQRKINLDKNNSGTADILLTGPSFIKIMDVWKDSSMDFLVMPGNDFTAVFDEQDKNFATYGGNWQVENEFYDSMMEDGQRRLDEIPQNDPAVFMQAWEKENTYSLSLIQVAGAHKIDRQYTDWVLQSVHSLFYSTLIRQLVHYITIHGRWPENMEGYINSMAPISNPELNNAHYFTSESDKDWVAQYGLFLAACQYYRQKNEKVPSLENLYGTAIEKAKKIKNPGIKKAMIQYLTKSVVDRTNDAGFLSGLQITLKGQIEAPYFNTLIKNRIHLLNIAPKGHPALIFHAEDKEGTAFSLETYKGKYIFIDVWATWCIPCRKQLPYLEKLKKKYAGKPIEFVSVSEDISRETWKKFINANGLISGQFISNPNLDKSISKTYQIRYIPSFILIDPMGNLISSNCYYPSDPAMDMLLETLLK